MNMKKTYISGLLLTLLASQMLADKYVLSPEIDQLFDEAKVKGTVVVYDHQADSCTVHNPDRVTEGFVPASTFKIANTLIGLSVGAVKDVDERLPYGGEPQPIKSWERNMGLRDAIKISNVPVYKELARRIGLNQMQLIISRIGYGNGKVGTSVDTFWLEGPMKISALQQAKFLARLARDELPFSKPIQKSVREIILIEQGDNWKLFGKTGWAQSIGWWVGWVEKEGSVYSFALNIDMPNLKDAPKRVALGKKTLKILGLLK